MASIRREELQKREIGLLQLSVWKVPLVLKDQY
jgi:hypothetical protein